MSADIYDLHEKAFARVSAFVVLKGGERVATIAFKFPADGAGRLYAFVHWIGHEMTRGHANGYGYDKQSAAAASAAHANGKCRVNIGFARNEACREFWSALADDNGWSWQRRLEDAGFTVLQAV